MPVPVARADFRRHLVPAGSPPVPEGATLVDSRITQGVPHAIPLDGGFSLLLVVPTGLATAWLAAPPTAVVTSSRPALAAAAAEPAPGDPLRPGAPARLVVLRAGAVAGAVPLVAGLRAVVPEADSSTGTRIEVLVREWDLRAGSLRGPGDVGSRISIAWRRIDLGTATFGGPAA
ncbi:hypothetical protein Pflav_012670 [Phytohabitans flavus]|uniref:Uncharacterized protein n=1 Tax=Phytohabitans flavus TaxID=1076124 RepID=A0A6F8XM23_9ACTN|nr:hypothetical protein [Phytohabitans flavus]BCB74857.1 hypothetical protein Pflav_012670 [Phytohabitans flavus]